jgi:NAD(P)H dehydrogenase (quinone)
VGRDDVADVATAVLADGGHAGSTYEVTGPEALTMAETAELLSRVVGREVHYVEETLDEARASRRPSRHPDWEIEGWVTSYAAIAAGDLARVTDTVERIAGHPPRSLEQVMREHPESYSHLT